MAIVNFMTYKISVGININNKSLIEKGIIKFNETNKIIYNKKSFKCQKTINIKEFIHDKLHFSIYCNYIYNAKSRVNNAQETD